MRTGISWFLPVLLLAATPAPGQQPPAKPVAGQPSAEAKPAAPEAREVLRTCEDPLFIECFKQWRPGLDRRRGQPPASAARPPETPQKPNKSSPPPNNAKQPPYGSDDAPPPGAMLIPEGKTDDSKPEEQKPEEKKTDEPNPPENMKPADMKPADMKPEDVTPGAAEVGKAGTDTSGPGGLTKPGEAKPGDTKTGATDPNRTGARDRRPGESKPAEKPPEKSVKVSPPPDSGQPMNKPIPPAPPPPPESEQDLATYEALARSIQEQGLQDRLQLGGPPKGGSVTLEVKMGKPARPRPVSPNPDQWPDIE
ncbi:MAG: hypothetical protein WCF85_06645 [Rhodospirillaceae bacterium]